MEERKEVPVIKEEEVELTIFNGVSDSLGAYSITLEKALQRIKSGSKSKELVEDIRRRFRSGLDITEQKKALPAIVFGGRADRKVSDNKGGLTLRADGSITKHSGFFVLDFDEGQTDQIMMRLRQDTYIYAAWAGVTKGAKALVKCPPSIVNHKRYYNAFLARYPELDPTSCNISRLCFESYDPDLWVNPNSQVWDKLMTAEELKAHKEKRDSGKMKRILDIAGSMIRAAVDGTKHETLLKASKLLGGAISARVIDEKTAVAALETFIKSRKIKSFDQAKKTIQDGIREGKKFPIKDFKQLEKSVDFLIREDGSYDFFASDEEMDRYESDVINGTLEMGLPSGIPKLDQHWMFKKNHLVWLAARDNVGKSYVWWYLATLVAMTHGWKVLMYSKENGDGQVRKKIKEFYIGKSIKLFTEEDKKRAKEFINAHFKFFTSKKMHTAHDFFLKCEIVHDEGWEYDLVVADPYNAFDIPDGVQEYTLVKKVMNMLQTFKANYASVWVADHVSTEAARDRNKKDKTMTVPTKHDVEFGQMKPNKVDDFLIAHRNYKDKSERRIMELHVDKIKDVETGGMPTPVDEPVLFIVNQDMCGYSINGVDPIKNYWERSGIITGGIPTDLLFNPVTPDEAFSEENFSDMYDEE